MLPEDTADIVAQALDEDIGPSGDITTRAVVEPELEGRASLVAREKLVVSGLTVAAEVFAQIDPDLEVDIVQEEGKQVASGEILLTVEGNLGSILTAERCCVNFVQHMSGIATNTKQFVERLGASSTRLVDTRKTRPGLRSLEKYAVACGGGHNHRFNLSDGVMIKDNHIVAAGGITTAVKRALANAHHLVKVQVEVENLTEAFEAVEAGATVLLLDNFTVEELRHAVQQLRSLGRALTLEASGGINLDTVAEVASTGVDVISSGALIHQARWVDVALDFVPS
jgi:nicotinate-nucleotide pyrophosphorylase (carboxylating)